MKKYSIIFVVLLMLIPITGCKKVESYQVGEERLFIDEIYKYIESNKKNYCLVDVRDLDDSYAKGHFKGFINYDIQKGDIDEFIYKMESMYSKDKTIFIIDENGSDVEKLQEALKKAKYKKVIIYLGGYQKLEQENQNDFEIVTGKDDCGC